jgi:hypothetical protein
MLLLPSLALDSWSSMASDASDSKPPPMLDAGETHDTKPGCRVKCVSCWHNQQPTNWAVMFAHVMPAQVSARRTHRSRQAHGVATGVAEQTLPHSRISYSSGVSGDGVNGDGAIAFIGSTDSADFVDVVGKAATVKKCRAIAMTDMASIMPINV